MPLGVIDAIIDEPQGGAHHDPDSVYQNVREYVLSTRKELISKPIKTLLQQRYQKFRTIGKFQVD